ncbi:C45 family autoproteolytic acyltransferase/hydolase [Polymorphum gilvum]|uniref:Peptidase C45 acyl-coenzyme A:6-aminopenicillanic acid acyl-transferase n=1 Tax=Polymorphum gilvum (strain LMG 25793 / CGMCC 1.9160 / SL003B-26A1) TaxID=991905 RepID=F2J4I6_POLGS|nr:C45 family peptidase [Polymorphum gilvum]ADZ72239.1 Peptidase C45 acyl-coenzyme A:6-aminopenicillanic acid acyl-transferase [Polymorphum gilvum SL003B-26A1]
MSVWRPEPAAPIRLSGDARQRGLGQALLGGAPAEAVRRATEARVEAARRDGLIDADGLAFVERQRACTAEVDPDALAEVAGIAEGFGIAEEILFTHLHLGILRDLKSCREAAGDGCSAWAVGDGPDGPLVVKNRDFLGTHLGVQRVFRHDDPAWRAGPVLCVGSLGSPGAYSSGMNAQGLALVDTQVGTGDHGPGWLRYFLMTRILADCRSVDEAIALIRGSRHAGGGTLVLADASGATAAVELGHSRVVVDTGGTRFRTNHFVSDALAGATLKDDGDRISGNSLARFAVLSVRLPGRVWSAAEAARLMASHAPDGGDGSLCQHPGVGDASTISSSVFACAARSLYFAEGNPCGGVWRRYDLVP